MALNLENFDTKTGVYYTSGNAYKMVGDQLMSAPLFVDGSVDESCWCEVMDNDWNAQKVVLFFEQYNAIRETEIGTKVMYGYVLAKWEDRINDLYDPNKAWL